MSDINGDLNNVIATAVQARVQSEVLAALSGDEVIGQFVASALQQKVEVPNSERGYGTVQVPFLTNVLNTTIRAVTKQAVQEVIEQEVEPIRHAVRAALRTKVDQIADDLVSDFAENVKSGYTLQVAINGGRR